MAGSRHARLADRRAATLLGALRTPAARVLAAPDGFRVAAAEVASPCAVVIDPSRPEEPGDHDARLARMIADCAPDGTVALVACGGETTATRPLAPRGWARARATLIDAGFAVSLTPFDVLGSASPWRVALGGRRDRVLAELDAHLTAPSVRAAARIVETHLVAALAPEQTGRVLVVGHRGAPPPAAPPSRAAFDAAMRPLLHDDAVVRWLAFVDAELLTDRAARGDVVAWMRSLAPEPSVAALLRARGRWWHEELEVQRLGEAAAHRLARCAVEALAAAPEGALATTLEYDLVAGFNAAIGAWIDES